MKSWMKLLISVIGCELVGVLSALFTISGIKDWYLYLNKPFFAPPNWIFGPAWTTLYFLMGVAIYLIWTQDQKKKKVKMAVQFFLAQLAVNFIWSPIFFGLRAPALGLVTILVMWGLVFMTMKKFYPISKPAFYLLVPYIAWVSFATLLNAAIVVLN